MHDRGPHLASIPRHLARLAREAAASLRVRCAFFLGVIGLALLIAAATIGIQRQRALEAHAAHMTPMDDEGNGYYLVNPPVEPIVPVERAELVSASGVLWMTTAVLLASGAGLAWYLKLLRQRDLEQQVQRYRRPRSGHPPARLVAKRKVVSGVLASETRGQRRGRLIVRQVMTEAVVVAPPTASLKTVTNLLMSSPLRHVLVCDQGGRLLGVITDRDLRNRHGRCAADIMTRDPACVPPGALLGPAVTMMVDQQISCLPVVEQGRVRGVLTSDDLALALDCMLQTQALLIEREVPASDETAVLSSVQTLCETLHAKSGEQPLAAVAQGELPS